jgi:plasmid stabilization system protein ParE
VKVTFTKKAEKKLDEVVEHLEKKHSKKHADKFLKDFKHRLDLVKENPYMFEATPKSEQIRKGHVNKFISFFYRIYSKTIRVLLVKDNRSEP